MKSKDYDVFDEDEVEEAFDRVLKEVIGFMKKSDKVFKELAMSTSKITSFEKETAKIEGLYNFHQFIKNSPSDGVSEKAVDFFSLMSTFSTACSGFSDQAIQSQFDAFETALAGQTE
jgi:hypothetical protein